MTRKGKAPLYGPISDEGYLRVVRVEESLRYSGTTLPGNDRSPIVKLARPVRGHCPL
jgi:hypothetical protein